MINTELYAADDGKRKVTEWAASTMVTYARRQDRASKIEVEVNQYFLVLYGASMSTALDVEARAKLKGDVAKAAYRFFQTQAPSSVPYGLLTLCHALNLNTEQPVKVIRRQIRAALQELIDQGHLKKGSRIDEADNVHIKRA